MIDLGSLATSAGVAVAVFAVLSFLMPALNLSPDHANRFGPLIAVLVGVAIATVAAVLGLGAFDPALDLGQRIFAAVLTGMVGGLQAIGIHQGVKKTVLGKPSS